MIVSDCECKCCPSSTSFAIGIHRKLCCQGDSIADAWQPASHGYARNASDATARGLQAGCDMDCGNTYTSGASSALDSGALPMAALDTAVVHSMTMRFRLGEFDPPQTVLYRNMSLFGPSVLDSDTARSTALRAAELFFS